MLKERRLKNKSHSLDLTDVSGSDLQFVPDVVQNNWALLLCVQFDSLDWKRIRTWRCVSFISPRVPQTGSSPAALMLASSSCGTPSTGTSWPMSTSCGRSHKPALRPKYDWPLPNLARCPSSTWPPTGRWGGRACRVENDSYVVLMLIHDVCVLWSSSWRRWAAACTCTAFWARWWSPTGRSLMTPMSYTPCCCPTGETSHTSCCWRLQGVTGIIYLRGFVLSLDEYFIYQFASMNELFDLWPLQTQWSLLTALLSSAAHLDQLWHFSQRQIESLLLEYILVSHRH